jgi:hypothetical protein
MNYYFMRAKEEEGPNDCCALLRRFRRLLYVIVYMSQFWAPTKISTTKRHHYELLHSSWRIPRIDPLSGRAQTASLLSTNHHQVGRSVMLRCPRPVRNAGDQISNASDFNTNDETSRQGQHHVLMRPKDQVRQKFDPE